MKNGVLLPHPVSMQLYLDHYGFDITNNFARKFYEDIMHLFPAKIYDTEGADYQEQLENAVLKHALDKTDEGLVKCKACIEQTLGCLIEEIVDRDGVLMFLSVTKITPDKLYIEIEDIGEHNGNGKIV